MVSNDYYTTSSLFTSKALVASSNNSIDISLNKALAIAILYFYPPLLNYFIKFKNTLIILLLDLLSC